MRYCRRCVFSDTKPDLIFHPDGVCDACRTAEKKDTTDWIKRKKQLERIFEKYRSKDGTNYDCIVPVSGGKDSHYQVHVVKNIYGLNPLCVCFEPTLPTPLGRKNLKNLNNLGVDLIHIKRNPLVYKKMVIEGLKRVGDNEWPNHVGIFTAPFGVAVRYRVPLLVWGENQTEYGDPERDDLAREMNRRWLEELGGFLGYRVSDMMDLVGFTKNQLLPYIFPGEEELKKVGVMAIFLGYYLKWDTRKQLEISKSLGFSTSPRPIEGTYGNWENLDCDSMTVHDYLKFVKYGFGRGTDHACLDIRSKLITRQEGVKLVEKYDGKLPQKALSRFLDYIEMSREEFFEIIDPFANRDMFELDSKGKVKRTQDGNLILRPEVIEARRRP